MRYTMNNYLMHHGIKGQKWGIRRFQNEDGSLTPEGQERYNQLTDRQKKNFHKMNPKMQKRLLEDMNNGKSYSASVKEARKRAARKSLGAFLGLSLVAAGLVGASAYVAAKREREREDQLRDAFRRTGSALDEQMRRFRMQQEQMHNWSKQFDDFVKSRSSTPLNSIHLSPEDYIIR